MLREGSFAESASVAANLFEPNEGSQIAQETSSEIETLVQKLA